jgi:CMP-N-acetylneuraminic acid synthetase
MAGIKPKVLAVIPAKGRSTRIPGKNMKDFNGQPLLYWTIQDSVQSKWVTYTGVSSDCPEILSYATQHGALAIPRADDLCQDDTPTDPVILHAVKYVQQALQMEFDMVVTLQCTSPVRPDDLVDDCIKALYSDPGSNSVVTVHDAGHFAWQLSFDNFNWCQVNAHRRPVSQKMDPADKIYMENGSVVVTRAHELLAKWERVVPRVKCYPIDSKFAIDIDTEDDFMMAESIGGK